MRWRCSKRGEREPALARSKRCWPLNAAPVTMRTDAMPRNYARLRANLSGSMLTLETQVLQNGVCKYRPQGRYSLVEAVDLISSAIARCRDRAVNKLMVDVTGIDGLPVPTLVDRFLMVEEWAQEAKGTVVVAIVAPPEYIHPRKFGVTVALHFGLICNVHVSEEEALQWLVASAPPDGLESHGTRA